MCDTAYSCVTWLIHMCDMTHSYVWHDSFICVTWHIRMCDMTHLYVWRDSFIRMTWPIRICDMTHSYVWPHSSICVTWRIRMCAMTHSYVCHDEFVYVTWLIGVSWLIHMCAMIHRYGTGVPWLIHTCAMTHRCDVTHPYVRHDPWIFTTSITGQMHEGRVHRSTHQATAPLYFEKLSHVSHVLKSWHTYAWVMSHTWIRYGTRVTWLNGMRNVTPTRCASSIVDMMHSYAWRDSFVRVMWLILTCAVTHSHVWRDSSPCLVRKLDGCQAPFRLRSFTPMFITHTCMCVRVPRLIHTYICVCMCHDSFKCVMRFIRMHHMTPSHGWNPKFNSHIYMYICTCKYVYMYIYT